MDQISNSVKKNPKHLLELTKKEKQDFLESFDIVLSDCDGVLWAFSSPIANSGEAINLLKTAGKQFKFVSNNDGMRTDRDYIDKLENMGVNNIKEDDFILPYKAFARFMKTQHPGKTCYCTGSEYFMNSLKSTGVKVVDVTPHFNIKPEELRYLTPIKEATIFVVDIHINMTFAEFALIQQYLLKEDCDVYINAVDDRFPITDDFSVLGVGLFIEAITKLCNKDMKLFGKPSKFLADYMVEEFQIKNRKRALFVGDSLDSDIAYACAHGFRSLFVLSGTYTIEDMMQMPIEKQPDYYANSLGDFVEFFRSLKDESQ
ncbi:uncharacterized protein [Musca autumnalis]|uniref:uncharacterized protein n=1 Tax=Musca autumnalis TaxID=221902 RepID=UPI003CF2BC90